MQKSPSSHGLKFGAFFSTHAPVSGMHWYTLHSGSGGFVASQSTGGCDNSQNPVTVLQCPRIPLHLSPSSTQSASLVHGQAGILPCWQSPFASQ